MALTFCSVSGFNEVGKNMSAVRCNNDAVLLDCGFYIQKLAEFEDHARASMGRAEMIKSGAIPNDNCITDWRPHVKAMVSSHAHLDHIGATPYLAPNYNAPFVGTPYTVQVMKHIIKDEGFDFINPIKKLNAGSTMSAGDIDIEFINATHSVPQAVMVAVHTKDGIILYTNDYKFDNHPVIGKKPDYQRLKELGKEGVKLLVSDSLYSGRYQKTPSEKVAKEMLKDVLLGLENKGSAIVVTCFSSNIARLKSIVEFGKKLNRKVVFLGRSLMKYTTAAEEIGLINFTKDVDIVGYGDKVRKKLSKIGKENKGDYLIVCTGGQAEPNSIISRMIRKKIPFHFTSDDNVIFSNKVIPVEPNVRNREELENHLRKFGVRIFKDIHVSGHGSREDLRDLIKMTNPEHVVPGHGGHDIVKPTKELIKEMGYSKTQCHLMKNGQTIRLD